jgi:hypothetical protein
MRPTAALLLLACLAARAEPELPAGLGEPALPAGLDGPVTPAAEPAELETDSATVLAGFWEARLGGRTGDDPLQDTLSIAETRLQLAARHETETYTATLTGDLLLDPLAGRHRVDLETGQGWLDLREANLAFGPAPALDVKLGRQILTWGTGDLLFVNDLFPKDWQAFFIGRNVDYLKAPSDALRLAAFSELANLDLVLTPRFDADRFVSGERLSFFDPFRGRKVGEDEPLRVDRPHGPELALRLYRALGPLDLAAYAYRGHWKSPGGFDPASGRATFPDLAVYGASALGPLAGGIANLELGYYDSRDDRDGDDPLVRNSEWRLLLGYRRELARDFTAGVQYYLERIAEHGALRAALPAGAPRPDRDRHLLTLRLTRLAMRQDLRLSLFGYWSPSDRDGYLRPKARYQVDDAWSVELGGNLLFGDREHTFFGQLRDDSNVYAALRYAFVAAER